MCARKTETPGHPKTERKRYDLTGKRGRGDLSSARKAEKEKKKGAGVVQGRERKGKKKGGKEISGD